MPPELNVDLLKLLLMPHADGLAFWRSRVVLTPEQYKQLDDALRSRAFTVSGVACANTLNSIFGLIDQALESGMTVKQFIDQTKTLLERRGITGPEPFQLRTVFVTNMQTAYQSGRYKQMTDPDVAKDRPFWKYTSMHDQRVRPSHRALDGTVRRHDDPFWKEHYPPNGYGCRCAVQNMTAEEVAAEGLTVGQGDVIYPSTGQAIRPDAGFGNNPARFDWKPDLSNVAPAIQRAFTEKFGGAH